MTHRPCRAPLADRREQLLAHRFRQLLRILEAPRHPSDPAVHHRDSDGERTRPGSPSHFVHPGDELVPGTPQPPLVRQVGTGPSDVAVRQRVAFDQV